MEEEEREGEAILILKYILAISLVRNNELAENPKVWLEETCRKMHVIYSDQVLGRLLFSRLVVYDPTWAFYVQEITRFPLDYTNQMVSESYCITTRTYLAVKTINE